MIYQAQDHCKHCLNYLGGRKCRAFPDSIPNAVWQGENLHHDPVAGDQGYRFEARPSLLDVDASEVIRRD